MTISKCSGFSTFETVEHKWADVETCRPFLYLGRWLRIQCFCHIGMIDREPNNLSAETAQAD